MKRCYDNILELIGDTPLVRLNRLNPNPQVPVYVKLRIRDVPGGVRVYRKNPITGTFHEWRITGGPAWRAFRTAP